MPAWRARFDRALRLARWRAFREALGRSWLVLALLGLLLGVVIYHSASPRRVIATVNGEIIGAHQQQREEGNGVMVASVLLDSQGTVSVVLPRHVAYRPGARVVIQVIRRDWPPRLTRYRFAGYAPDEEKLE